MSSSARRLHPADPLAGRTFESFSEDPLLTASIAVAYIRGVQRRGVACCIKHFACNDQEHERMSISAEVDERTLREIHLVAFEQAVQEAGVWSVMTAYNRVNGEHCCEQPQLLGQILGRNGASTGSSCPTGSAPTPPPPLPRRVSTSRCPDCRPGSVPPSPAPSARAPSTSPVLDRQVGHMLRLMQRVGLLDGTYQREAEREDDVPEHRALARTVAVEGTVMLVNDGLLPLPAPVLSTAPTATSNHAHSPATSNAAHSTETSKHASSAETSKHASYPSAAATTTTSIAVIGPNAVHLAMGGGSSEVTPHRRRSLPEALADRLPGVEVTYEVGCHIDRGLPSLDMRLLSVDDLPESFTLEYFDSADLTGDSVHTELAHLPRIMWLGQPRPISPSDRFRSGSEVLSSPTRVGPGAWVSRVPGAPCCVSTATSSSTTQSRSPATAFTAWAAPWSRQSSRSRPLGPTSSRSISGPGAARTCFWGSEWPPPTWTPAMKWPVRSPPHGPPKWPSSSSGRTANGSPKGETPRPLPPR